jgi:hypothetical protein
MAGTRGDCLRYCNALGMSQCTQRLPRRGIPNTNWAQGTCDDQSPLIFHHADRCDPRSGLTLMKHLHHLLSLHVHLHDACRVPRAHKDKQASKHFHLAKSRRPTNGWHAEETVGRLRVPSSKKAMGRSGDESMPRQRPLLSFSDAKQQWCRGHSCSSMQGLFFEQAFPTRGGTQIDLCTIKTVNEFAHILS